MVTASNCGLSTSPCGDGRENWQYYIGGHSTNQPKCIFFGSFVRRIPKSCLRVQNKQKGRLVEDPGNTNLSQVQVFGLRIHECGVLFGIKISGVFLVLCRVFFFLETSSSGEPTLPTRISQPSKGNKTYNSATVEITKVGRNAGSSVGQCLQICTCLEANVKVTF